MSRPLLLIAALHQGICSHMLRAAALAGYRVKAVETTARLLCLLLRREEAVVLLGDNFEETLPLAELIRLMKACRPHLAIILVSDRVSLQQIRRARQLGIFYHALLPESPPEWQELEEAVVCAFRAAASAPSRSRVRPNATGRDAFAPTHAERSTP